MRNTLKHSIVFFFLFTFLMASGGATIYTHFCEIAKACEVGNFISPVEHSCEEKIEEEKDSCHKSENDKDECCAESSEYDVFEQISTEVQAFHFITPLIKYIDIQFTETTVSNQQQFSKTFESPPLIHDDGYYKLFQQFLC